jgi:heme O synthase-like polyprenyltransferase
MKTIIHLIFTIFISTMCLMSALGNPSGWILYLITLAVWAWFFWTLYKRFRKNDEKAAQQELFQEYMRSQIRRNQGY